MRRLVLLAVVGALALPAASPAYPPITCGKTKVGSRTLLVRTHGPSCSFAIKWVRAFVAHKKQPPGYHCRAYGAGFPADCLNKTHKKRYFQGSAAG